ncbi:MAG: hypothetical protein JWN95_1383 [Frankiales bacterium]|nr:hypothetical protein [Frankiales bacterium]
MRGTMTLHLDAVRVPEFLADIGTANRFAFAAEAPSVRVQIGDVPVDVGPIRYYAAEAEISSEAAALRTADRSRPDGGDPSTRRRVLLHSAARSTADRWQDGLPSSTRHPAS